MTIGANTSPTLVVDKNGRLTTVHKGTGKVGTSSPAVSTKVRNAATRINPSVRDYQDNGAANAALDDIAELEDLIALKAVTGLINEVRKDFPDATKIVLETDNSTGLYEVSYIRNSANEPYDFDEQDANGIYSLFAARIDVESSLVKETQYADRYVIEWENG